MIHSSKKITYSELSIELDKFFFLPFGKDESPEMRAEALDAYLKSVGWTWSEILNHLLHEDLSRNDQN